MKVIIADDHALFRDSLRSLLKQRGVDVIAEASTGREAVVMAKRFHPDVVLMDLNMPELGGLDATHLICAEMPDVKVVVLSASDDDEDLFEAIRSGAKGYLLKDLPADKFFHYLEGLALGEPALMPHLAQRLLNEFARPKEPSGPTQDNPDNLTAREKEILVAMVEGVTTNRALANHFGVSKNTIKFHVRNILDKLHVHNRTQVVSFALRHGLVKTDGMRRL